jgi:hypothetical protein
VLPNPADYSIDQSASIICRTLPAPSDRGHFAPVQNPANCFSVSPLLDYDNFFERHTADCRVNVFDGHSRFQAVAGRDIPLTKTNASLTAGVFLAISHPTALCL